MPKLKSNKTLSKRLKITKTGKILVRFRSGQHLKSRLSSKSARKSGNLISISPAIARAIKRHLI